MSAIISFCRRAVKGVICGRTSVATVLDGGDRKVLERGDAVFERRVRRPDRRLLPLGNAHRLERIRQDARLEVAEAAQRRDHRRRRAQETRRTGIRRVFALAREPKDDERREDAERELQHHHEEEVEPAAVAPALALPLPGIREDGRENARDDDHEGVEDALHERERHHVAVRHMAHLVAENGAQLLPRHLPHDVRRDGDEGVVAERARRKGVRRARIDRDLRHGHARAAREVFDRRDEPALGLSLGAVDRPRAARHLCHRLREQKRDERAHHAVDEREDEEIRPFRPDELGDGRAEDGAEEIRDDAQRKHHGEVRDQEKNNAFHDGNYIKITELRGHRPTDSRPRKFFYETPLHTVRGI